MDSLRGLYLVVLGIFHFFAYYIPKEDSEQKIQFLLGFQVHYSLKSDPETVLELRHSLEDEKG